jgi:hypothetical protein
MSSNEKQTATAEKSTEKKSQSSGDKGGQLQKKAQSGQVKKRAPPVQEEEEDEDEYEDESEDDWPEPQMPARYGKHRMVPVHQSRIADRPYKEHNSAMNIKIELDLEVEVEIYARVKGDVTIGLM